MIIPPYGEIIAQVDIDISSGSIYNVRIKSYCDDWRLSKTMLCKRNNLKAVFFKEFINECLEEEISSYLIDTIKNGYTVRGISHSIRDIVKIDAAIIVVVEVKGFDYALKRRCKGYFALEYSCVSNNGYIVVSRYSRSMPDAIKKAANVPYGGW